MSVLLLSRSGIFDVSLISRVSTLCRDIGILEAGLKQGWGCPCSSQKSNTARNEKNTEVNKKCELDTFLFASAIL